MSTSGVIVVDKPRGPTSHDVVAWVRKALGTRQVGHAGTLDPMATGVLVVAVDEATKLVQWLTSSDKTYEATIRLGVETDSLDAEGRETMQKDVPADVLAELGNIEVTTGNIDVTAGFPRLAEALAAERTRTEQIPPAFSAIRVGGARSHVLARRGEAPDLESRTVEVRRLDVTGASASPPELRLVLEVTKGYFVRSLARDLALALGTLGHLTSLRRTRAGAFGLEDAYPLVDLEKTAAPLTVIPLDVAAARALPVSTLTEAGIADAMQGRRVKPSDLESPHPCASAWLDAAGALVAVGESMPDGSGRVLRGFRRA
ncbi:MAG TPA: tRNA pseudouridine(55) synthase TruB [Labilithrix sp.]|jgi:tRNA pseudouridine55 synthase